METVATSFKNLPLSERIQLVEDIWDSIAQETASSAPQLTEEQRAELHRRFDGHQADPATSIPWEQVRAALFQQRP